MIWLAKRSWLMLIVGIVIANSVVSLSADELTVATTANAAKSLDRAADASKIFAGGIPLKRNGEVVGAIGVSGGSGEQDQSVAEAGAAAFS